MPATPPQWDSFSPGHRAHLAETLSVRSTQHYAIQTWKNREGWKTISTCEMLEPLLATYTGMVEDLKQGKLARKLNRLRLILILMDYEQ